MSEELFGALIVGIPFLTLICGVIIVVAGMIFKARTLEMQHRERLAMIERGLAPPPESTPTGSIAGKAVSPSTNRARSVGVIIIGIGFAFMCLIGIAAEAPQEAIGIGGAIVILGTAFIIRSALIQPPLPPLKPFPHVTLQGQPVPPPAPPSAPPSEP